MKKLLEPEKASAKAGWLRVPDAYFFLETTLTLQALYCRRQNIDMQLAAPITNPIKAAHINDG